MGAVAALRHHLVKVRAGAVPPALALAPRDHARAAGGGAARRGDRSSKDSRVVPRVCWRRRGVGGGPACQLRESWCGSAPARLWGGWSAARLARGLMCGRMRGIRAVSDVRAMPEGSVRLQTEHSVAAGGASASSQHGRNPAHPGAPRGFTPAHRHRAGWDAALQLVGKAAGARAERSCHGWAQNRRQDGCSAQEGHSAHAGICGRGRLCSLPKDSSARRSHAPQSSRKKGSTHFVNNIDRRRICTARRRDAQRR